MCVPLSPVRPCVPVPLYVPPHAFPHQLSLYWTAAGSVRGSLSVCVCPSRPSLSAVYLNDCTHYSWSGALYPFFLSLPLHLAMHRSFPLLGFDELREVFMNTMAQPQSKSPDLTSTCQRLLKRKAFLIVMVFGQCRKPYWEKGLVVMVSTWTHSVQYCPSEYHFFFNKAFDIFPPPFFPTAHSALKSLRLIFVCARPTVRGMCSPHGAPPHQVSRSGCLF